MIHIRKSEQRGLIEIDWLKSYHSFSFGDYFDPDFMGFRALRVINEDWVKPGKGFGTHPHRDMEIVTVILEGALEHKDSMGTGSVIRPGEVQRMSAGTGVTHSEFNGSKKDPVHLLQIWILPEKNGLKPSYEQKTLPEAERRGRLRVIASRDGREGSVTIHQDAAIYAAVLGKGEKLSFPMRKGRHAWIQVAKGSVTVQGTVLEAGDGAAVAEEEEIAIAAKNGGELLLFDLA